MYSVTGGRRNLDQAKRSWNKKSVFFKKSVVFERAMIIVGKISVKK